MNIYFNEAPVASWANTLKLSKRASGCFPIWRPTTVETYTAKINYFISLKISVQ
jgi:hypothetical protein